MISQYLFTAAVEFNVNSLLARFGKSSLFSDFLGFFHYCLFLLFFKLGCTFNLIVLISHLLISRWQYWSGIPLQLNCEALKVNLSSKLSGSDSVQASARQSGKNTKDLSFWSLILKIVNNSFQSFCVQSISVLLSLPCWMEKGEKRFFWAGIRHFGNVCFKQKDHNEKRLHQEGEKRDV